MPDTGSPWELPYPAIGDQADVPGDMGGLAAAVAAALTSLSGDIAAGPPHGTVLLDTDAFTAATGWSLSQARLVRVGVLVFWWLRVTRTGAAITVTATGDLTNAAVATLVPPMTLVIRGVASSAGNGRSAQGLMLESGGGLAQVSSVSGSASIATGEEISLGGAFVAV